MHLHSSLQLHLLLLLLVELHDLDLILLEYSALLDVELLLGLGVDLLGLLVGLLLDEGHHVLDLRSPADSSSFEDTHQHSTGRYTSTQSYRQTHIGEYTSAGASAQFEMFVWKRFAFGGGEN